MCTPFNTVIKPLTLNLANSLVQFCFHFCFIMDVDMTLFSFIQIHLLITSSVNSSLLEDQEGLWWTPKLWRTPVENPPYSTPLAIEIGHGRAPAPRWPKESQFQGICENCWEEGLSPTSLYHSISLSHSVSLSLSLSLSPSLSLFRNLGCWGWRSPYAHHCFAAIRVESAENEANTKKSGTKRWRKRHWVLMT